MDWLNLHIPTVGRSPEYLGSSPAERGTWLSVMMYACQIECNGRIEGAAEWKDRQWQQTAGVTLEEVQASDRLMRFEDGDLIINGYPREIEKQIRANRKNAKAGGMAKWGTKTEANLKRSERLSEARSKGTHTEAEWLEMVDHYRSCVRCGATDMEIVKDHIVPIYQGGSDGIGNLQPLCRHCNRAKGPESIDWRPKSRFGLPAKWAPSEHDAASMMSAGTSAGTSAMMSTEMPAMMSAGTSAMMSAKGEGEGEGEGEGKGEGESKGERAETAKTPPKPPARAAAQPEPQQQFALQPDSQPPTQPSETTPPKPARKKPARAEKASLSDEAWIAETQANPGFAHIDVRAELGRCLAWFAENRRGLVVTRGRAIAWFTRAAERTTPAPRSQQPTQNPTQPQAQPATAQPPEFATLDAYLASLTEDQRHTLRFPLDQVKTRFGYLDEAMRGFANGTLQWDDNEPEYRAGQLAKLKDAIGKCLDLGIPRHLLAQVAPVRKALAIRPANHPAIPGWEKFCPGHPSFQPLEPIKPDSGTPGNR